MHEHPHQPALFELECQIKCSVPLSSLLLLLSSPLCFTLLLLFLCSPHCSCAPLLSSLLSELRASVQLSSRSLRQLSVSLLQCCLGVRCCSLLSSLLSPLS